ncbi:hypothetical protein OE88DRAFT_1731974 [Heliocybe sulcata]|uniref:DNA 3'-5' helicase n=1 Tax=Heliocybe sulcata TaxID=5364 RepID=A0A5C3NBI8_9AGAM|nr:hypothetical protein OE88DRAFT_1731974 [Heliocybe sulcata]
MYDQSFDEMAREYGLDAEEYNSNAYVGYAATQSHIQDQDYMGDFDSEFPEGFSSPCPLGRSAGYDNRLETTPVPNPMHAYYNQHQQSQYANEIYVDQSVGQSQQTSASYSSHSSRGGYAHGVPESAPYTMTLPHVFKSISMNRKNIARTTRKPPVVHPAGALLPNGLHMEIKLRYTLACKMLTLQGLLTEFVSAQSRNFPMHTEAYGNSDPVIICVVAFQALCSERYRDWTTKFEGLGIKCCELTGDTVQFGKSAWGEARNAAIIITTGEKWDSLTRHWKDNGQILAQVQLFLVDEVHILNESRGSTLEVVISRMKIRGTSVRFVMVSATVPNIEDIAAWVGSRDKSGSAKVFQFGEEFRPCKLTKHVYGVPRHRNQNEYQYSSTLDKKIFPILQQHSVNKPILVFVPTRKGVLSTAEHLASEYEQAAKVKQPLPWSQPRGFNKQFHDKRLEKLSTLGIGVHHAGLSMDDRRVTEELYKEKVLRVLVATSTLAVGVNLPAHTVMIRGVKMYQSDGYKEYSDLDVMQMMGRAGRPQFDKDGIAIVLCEPELEAKYRNLVQGKTVLESCLHQNLSEHLNSEIGLGTITDIGTAKEWLHNSFLFQRLRRNPAHYSLGKPTGQSWQESLDDMVMQSVKTLKESELVEYDEKGENGSLISTEYGDIMSKFYVRQATMNVIMKLPERAGLRDMLEGIAAADEFSDLKLRSGEKKVYKDILDHQDIRYKIKKVDKPADKVFVLLQAVLGGIALNRPEYRTPDSQPPLDALGVFRHVGRIARVVVEVALVKKQGGQIKHGLELCLTAKAWEDRPVVLRQIEQIGDKSIKVSIPIHAFWSSGVEVEKVLAERGITSLDALRKQDPLRIETLLNRRPPFGHEVLACLADMPQYFLNVSEQGVESTGGKGPVSVTLSIECGLISDGITHTSKPKKNKSRRGDMTAILSLTSDLDFIDFRRISTKALATSRSFIVTADLTKPSQSVSVYIASENIAGIVVSRTLKPQVDPREFPVANTRPLNSLEADLEGLEDDPHFWDMTFEEEEGVRDLTKPRKGTTQEQSKLDKRASKGGSALLGTLDFKPKKLENGNYEQGIPKPPPPPKRPARQDTASDKGTPKAQPSRSTEDSFVQIRRAEDVEKLKQRDKKKQQRPDFRLQHLEKLHERTNVASSLGLSEGRRLKIEDSDGIKRSKAKPDFDLDFVSLDDEDERGRVESRSDDSDDDLPDLKELVHETRTIAPRAGSCSEITVSDDPELDAAILQMPSDEAKTDKKTENEISQAAGGRKRGRDHNLDVSSISVKRHRGRVYTPQCSPSRSVLSPKIQQPDSLMKKREPLFIPSSPHKSDAYYDDHLPVFRPSTPLRPPAGTLGDPPTMDTEPEEFTLDDSLFDIVPSTNATLTSTSTFSTLDGDSSPTGGRSAKAPIADETALAGSSKGDTDQGSTDSAPATAWLPDEDTYDDGLAEFEAWLTSGAVELIP